MAHCINQTCMKMCVRVPPLSLSLPFSPSGALTLWLVLWLIMCRFVPGEACPKLCVCYPSPMTVSCQSQNFTSVPIGVPYDSQRVFLQNNHITELRADSFGFETQVCVSVCVCWRGVGGRKGSAMKAKQIILAKRIQTPQKLDFLRKVHKKCSEISEA